jgi:hypothetical protein
LSAKKNGSEGRQVAFIFRLCGADFNTLIPSAVGTDPRGRIGPSRLLAALDVEREISTQEQLERHNIDRSMSFRAVIESIFTAPTAARAVSSLRRSMCLNYDISTKLNVGSHSRS